MGLGKLGKAFEKDPDAISKSMFNLPKSMADLPADGVGFNVGDGLQSGVKGIRKLSSKRTTFRSIGSKEGKRLSKSGKKSALRKLKR